MKKLFLFVVCLSAVIYYMTFEKPSSFSSDDSALLRSACSSQASDAHCRRH